MLLVMLMSVTGAWAQEPGTVFLKLTATYASPYGSPGYDYRNALDGDFTTTWGDYYIDDMFLEFRTDSPQRVDAYLSQREERL